MIVVHAITGPPHSLLVSPSLGLLRLLELSVGAYSHPRSMDPPPSGSSWDEHTSINIGFSPGFDNSMNDPLYPRWCASLFHGPSTFLSLLPCLLGSVWSSPPIIEVGALATSASAAAWSPEVLESIRLIVTCVGWVPASVHS